MLRPMEWIDYTEENRKRFPSKTLSVLDELATHVTLIRLGEIDCPGRLRWLVVVEMPNGSSYGLAGENIEATVQDLVDKYPAELAA